MTNKPNVLVVDDERFIQDMMEEGLKRSSNVVAAFDGESALRLAQAAPPDLIICDVEMPGIDGYETCRRLKAIPALAHIPVIFVSGKDLIEDRLKGFEAGGDDYVTKPFNLLFLEAKVKALVALSKARRELSENVNVASSTAMTAMTSMGELGILLEGLKGYNASVNYQQLAEAMLACLGAFDLKGCVQLRTPRETLTYASNGPASPLDISVITHMSAMGRIEYFKSRMSITYEHVSILISNMPQEDGDRCGRLRDHLAMLVEAAEVRLLSLNTALLSEQRGAAITQAIGQLKETLRDIDEVQRKKRAQTALAVSVVVENVEKALLKLALDDKQEQYLIGAVRGAVEQVVSRQISETESQNKLTEVVWALQQSLS